MKKLAAWLMFACALAIVFGGTAVAADEQAKVAGKWEMTSQSPRGTMTSTLTFQQDGEKLKGTMTGPRGGETAFEGTVKGNEISFTVKRQTPNGEFTVEYKGTVSGDTIKGTTETPRGQREWTAKRVKE